MFTVDLYARGRDDKVTNVVSTNAEATLKNNGK
jgi:hypothetical protein